MKLQHMMPIATLRPILREDPKSIPTFMEADIAFEQLTEAANGGCNFCTVLKDGIMAFVDQDQAVRISFHQQIQDKSYEPRFGQMMPLRVEVIGHAKKRTTLLFYTNDGGIAERMPRFPQASHISLVASSSECLSKARTWLDCCMQQHGSLRCPSVAGKALPTRVIDVGDELNAPYLYESRPGEEGVWAALSYCWGKKQVLTTKTASLATHKSGIPLGDLPKTCQDAILVARALSIRYIWIDAICIVQDSPEDWEREAARMCSVYKDAMITFAARDSESSDVGLFLSRKQDIVELNVELDGAVGTVCIRREFSNFDLPLHGHVKRTPKGDLHVIPAVLKTRAWTMQEILLSSRILWFGAAEIGWSCWSSTACECEPEQTREYLDLTGHQYHDINEGFKLCSPSIIEDPSAIDWVTVWGELMQKYTTRNLTVASDRLPAISGLAAALQSRIGFEYLAGLWNTDLHKQLLWISLYSAYPDSDTFSSVYDEQYAPSWSWASVPGEVRLWTFESDSTRGRSKPIWQICSVDFPRHGLNQFGPSKGAITIESYLFPVRWIGKQLMWQSVPESTTSTGDLPFVDTDEIMWDPRSRTVDLDSLRGKRLWILAGSLHVPDSKEWSQCKGLVLTSLADGQTFVRLGYVEVHFDLSDTGSWEAWQKRGTWTTVKLV